MIVTDLIQQTGILVETATLSITSPKISEGYAKPFQTGESRVTWETNKLHRKQEQQPHFGFRQKNARETEIVVIERPKFSTVANHNALENEINNASSIW